MKKLAWVTAMTALFTVLSSSGTKAQTFTESGDAGETLGAAQVTTGTSLTSISGSLSASGDLADLFQIALTGGQQFSATTRNAATDQSVQDDLLGIANNVLRNPQLALFDNNGRGIYANDNFSGSSQATLLQNTPFTPEQSGIYYLAISSSGYNPVSSGGAIFPAMSTSNVGANGSGGGSSLTGFSGSGSGGGTYQIALSGAQAVPAPPATLGLLIMGALSACSVLKSQKNKRVN